MKYEDVFETTKSIFDESIQKADLNRVLTIKLLNCANLKEIGKVIKASDLLRHMTDIDVIILVNEVVFDKLEQDQKKMIADELIARVYYNFEKDSLEIINPDVNTFSMILKKIGADKYLETQELIRLIFQQIKEKESEEAKSKKEKKSKKQN